MWSSPRGAEGSSVHRQAPKWSRSRFQEHRHDEGRVCGVRAHRCARGSRTAAATRADTAIVPQARPGMGRRAQRLPARFHHTRAQHDRASGWQSGRYDTIIRTDSQPITKRPILFKAGTGIATAEQFLARNLTYFDAIFFFGVREADLSAQQKADLLSFV